MEIYILDAALRRVQVVDTFESLIWTERYADWGDFELALFSTVDTRGLFVSGVRLAMNLSHRVMVVETLEDDVDEEGKRILNVKGRSLEMLLENRVAKDTQSNLTTEPTWHLTGTPGAICRQIFNDICVTTNLTPVNHEDQIPFYTAGSMSAFPVDTIAETTTNITLDLEPTTVFAAIKNLCELYDLGFRLVRNYDMSQLYFNIYSGSDRTTNQTTLPAVVFSPNLDNLKNTKELTTIATSKNVAYVYSPVGWLVVYAEGIDPNISGFERQVLLVMASDITDSATATAQMTQRGKEALSQNQGFQAFDGEITPSSQYVYGIDYQLGDLIELQNIDGWSNNMRVTEQIFVHDAEGERSYPTLAINLFIHPGTWLAWDYAMVWADFTTEFWADLP